MKMSTNQIIVGTSVCILLMAQCAVIAEEEETKRKRRWWVHDIHRRRKSQADACNLVREMQMADAESFENYTIMTEEQFNKLLGILGSHLCKRSIRTPVSARDRLLITLRFLATGMSYASLSYAFRIGKSTVHNIIKETTEKIWECFQEEFIKAPTKDKMKETAQKFYIKTGLPNCVGAIDGKHCAIQAPSHSGTLYRNYKRFFSLVLLAVCDADYNFSYVNIGSYGSESDGGIFRRCELGQQLLNDELEFPEDDFLPNSLTRFPFYIVGDEAFPLKKRLMRPYGGRNLEHAKERFNTCLSATRVHIEKAFGILVSRFRIYHTTISASPTVAKSIIKSTVCLHNFIRKTSSRTAMLELSISGTGQTSNLVDIPQMASNRSANVAIALRDALKDYINNNQNA